jgi:hypothetical protein
VVGISISPAHIGFIKNPGSDAVQKAHAINLSLFAYANNQAQQYPMGKTSTEVFQKLLDENYATDPSIFYLPFPGKTPPGKGQKLKPENVGFDVTSGIDSNSSEQIPVVFTTGYKVEYVPGGAAVLIAPSSSHIRTWSEWWYDVKPLDPHFGIAVTYKTNSSTFFPDGSFVAVMQGGYPQLTISPHPPSKVIISHFIPLDFKPDGKTYRQLTPDGVLP